MADWPITGLPPRNVISTGSPESLGVEFAAASAAAGSSRTWLLSNKALFIPFTLAERYLAAQLFVSNGAAVSGNIDMGIYAVDGTKIVSIGTTAQAGTSVVQVFNITDTELWRGQFYWGLALDNATGTTINVTAGANFGSVVSGAGVYEMAAAFVLPATATFAASAATTVPILGMTGKAIF